MMSPCWQLSVGMTQDNLCALHEVEWKGLDCHTVVQHSESILGYVHVFTSEGGDASVVAEL